MMQLFGRSPEEWARVVAWVRVNHAAPRYMGFVPALLWCGMKFEQAGCPLHLEIPSREDLARVFDAFGTAY